jgi:hypothetical protein
MTLKHRLPHAFAMLLSFGLLAALLVPFATHSLGAAATTYYIDPAGSDTNTGTTVTSAFKSIQKAIDLAQPGAVITLAPGDYMQDVHSARDGLANAPITIVGPAGARVHGAGGARIFEINHDNITLDGFTIDGLAGNTNSISGYRDKLLYVQGKQPRDGVSGLKVLNMTFTNAGGECIRLRYFAQRNEIARSTISNCGIHDFRFGAGGKNGEGIYIGTAPEQRGDGKNPTTDPDQSNGNWLHDNRFNTQGNECVDIKEAAAGNLVEQNICTGQRDPESGGFDSRGSGNIFRSNESYGNTGAGMRLGGDTETDGIGNDVYGNAIHGNQAGGIKFQRQPQGNVCGNTMSNNANGNAVGTYKQGVDPTKPCAVSTGNPTPAAPVTATPVATATASPAMPTLAPATATSIAPSVATAMPITSATATPLPTTTGCSPAYVIDGRATTFIEAEQNTSRSGRFVHIADVGRAGGVYMSIPGSGMQDDVKTYLAFNLNVSSAGNFYVWLLGYGPDGSSDSFYIQADNGSKKQIALTQNGWSWKRAGSTLALSQGVHTLKILNREDGASVDMLLLTTDAKYIPAGPGTALAPTCR